jgi:LysM repeat protein
VNRRNVARVAAPVAFLAAVTIGALVVRAGFEHGKHRANTQPTVVTTTKTKTTRTHGRQLRTYTIQSGDTFASIAIKEGTTVARLEHLNPNVDPTTLHVGEKIRVQ